jgi:hypothetical protein
LKRCHLQLNNLEKWIRIGQMMQRWVAKILIIW